MDYLRGFLAARAAGCFWLLPFAIRPDAVTAINNSGASLAPGLVDWIACLAGDTCCTSRTQADMKNWIESTYEDGLVAAPVQTGASASPAARLAT